MFCFVFLPGEAFKIDAQTQCWSGQKVMHSVDRKVSQVPETRLTDPEAQKPPNGPGGEAITLFIRLSLEPSKQSSARQLNQKTGCFQVFQELVL